MIEGNKDIKVCNSSELYVLKFWVKLANSADGRAVTREKMLGAADRNFVKLHECFFLAFGSYTEGSVGESNHRCFFVSPEVYIGSSNVGLSLLGVISPICFLIYRVVFHRVWRLMAFLAERLLSGLCDFVASKFYYFDVFERAFLKVFAPRGGRARGRPHMTSSFFKLAFFEGVV